MNVVARRWPWLTAADWRAGLKALTMSIAANALLYLASGPTLGLFLGAYFAATLLLLPVEAGSRAPRPWTRIASTLLGTELVWLWAARHPDINLWDGLRSLPILTAYLIFAAGLLHLARRIGLAPPLAVALCTLLLLAWLTWPVWLSPSLRGNTGQRFVDLIVPVHPLFCQNAVVIQFGTWDHYPTLAYPMLTTLNQDLSYAVPRTTLWAIAAHLVVGVPLLAIGKLKPSPSPGTPGSAR